jgi:hypothetical protein
VDREVMVVAIKNLSGFVEVDKDGNWYTEKKRKQEVIPNPVCNLSTPFCLSIPYLLVE